MQVQYLLDTNICIYIIKKKPETVAMKFAQLPLGVMAMSAITYGELCYGIEKSQHKLRNQIIMDELIRFIPVLSLSENVAQQYALVRQTLEAQGRVIGNNDLWIAAHALAMDVTLVSNNLKEFNRVANLKTENWV